jgi:hypothetical protein
MPMVAKDYSKCEMETKAKTVTTGNGENGF